MGKTAIAEGLAQRMASGDVPERLKGKRLVALNLGLLLADTKYRGDFEENIKNVLEEARDDTFHSFLFPCLSFDGLMTCVGRRH